MGIYGWHAVSGLFWSGMTWCYGGASGVVFRCALVSWCVVLRGFRIVINTISRTLTPTVTILKLLTQSNIEIQPKEKRNKSKVKH